MPFVRCAPLAIPRKRGQAIAGELPEAIAAVLNPDELEPLHQRLRALPEPPARPHLTGDDLLGAAGVFGLVFFSTLPVVLPFVFISGPSLALRVSNLVAIVMLFLTGYIFGRSTGIAHCCWDARRYSSAHCLRASRLPSEDSGVEQDAHSTTELDAISNRFVGIVPRSDRDAPRIRISEHRVSSRKFAAQEGTMTRAMTSSRPALASCACSSN
jgi:hypothetical protein